MNSTQCVWDDPNPQPSDYIRVWKCNFPPLCPQALFSILGSRIRVQRTLFALLKLNGIGVRLCDWDISVLARHNDMHKS